MAYVVDRVVICDAFREPDKHYQLLPGGKSKLAQGRRPSVRFLASARDVKGGLAGVVGKEAGLFEDMLASDEQKNDFVNQLRDEVRTWRESGQGYSGTALVTKEWPLLKTSFLMAQELFEATNPGSAADLGIGPTFDELLDLSRRFLGARVRPLEVDGLKSELRDVGIYYWRRQAVDVLENAVRGIGVGGVEPVPILGDPEWLDSANLRRFQWTGVLADGKRCHTNKVACHTDLEKQFADFLDRATDVVRYFKNERFGFSVTYYEGNRPRQYYPDFIVVAREVDGREVTWLAETKGEIRPNTALKSEAARLWCEKMSRTTYGHWRYLFLQQKRLDAALTSGAKSLADLAASLIVPRPEPQLKLISLDDARVKRDAFKTLLPLYSLKAAAGYFGRGEQIEPEAWIEAGGVGKLDDQMFVARAVGRSMEPTIYDGDLLVFRANPTGTRQGKIVLAQYRGPADPETGGAFTVKRYSSEKRETADGEWRHARIVLSPRNKDFEPIVIPAEAADDFRVVAEFLAVLRSHSAGAPGGAS